MNLTSAAQTSNTALASLASQTALVSRNVAGAGDKTFARKTATIVTGTDGAGHVAGIVRAADLALRNTVFKVTSAAAGQQALSDGYDALHATLDDTDGSQSPSAAVSALSDALQQLSVSPGNRSLAAGVLRNAYTLADRLNDATGTVQALRQQADGDIAGSVAHVNGLLRQFTQVDAAIVRGTGNGSDTTIDQDKRDAILTELSGEVGITSTTRANGSTSIYTDGGVVLFDREPRKVGFVQSTIFAAGVAGNGVFVDGVDITASGSSQASASGRIVGLAALRDKVAPRYQSQLDETARGLILSFAEQDQGTPPTLPDAAGLFNDAGTPLLPGASLVSGLAGRVRVNASVDPDKGGNLDRIRDGGSAAGGNPAYGSNPTGAAGFSDRLRAIVAGLSVPLAFDAAAGLATSATLSGFANASIGDVEGGRKAATDAATQQGALRDRTAQALQSETGVNLDDELSRLLDLEHAYGASAKLLSAVDGLYTTLFHAIN